MNFELKLKKKEFSPRSYQYMRLMSCVDVSSHVSIYKQNWSKVEGGKASGRCAPPPRVLNFVCKLVEGSWWVTLADMEHVFFSEITRVT